MSLLRTTDSVLQDIGGGIPDAIPIFVAYENTIVESIILIVSETVTRHLVNYTEINVFSYFNAVPTLLFTITTENIDVIGIDLNKFTANRYDMELNLVKDSVIGFTKVDNGSSINLGNIAFNTNERRY